MRLCILCFLLFFCYFSNSLNPISGLNLIANAWNIVTEKAGLPVLKKTIDFPPIESYMCGSESTHQGVFHCININGTGYMVPHGITAQSYISGAKLDYTVTLIDSAAALSDLYKKVIVEKSSSLFHSSTTTKTYIYYFWSRYKHSFFMAQTHNYASLYSLIVDKTLLEILYLKGDTSYLDNNFVTAIIKLPDMFNNNSKGEYYTFINNYGTHFVEDILMGGKVKMIEWFNQCFLLSGNYNRSTIVKETSSLFSAGLDYSSDWAADVNTCFLYNAFLSYSYSGGLITQFSSQQWNKWYDTIPLAPAPIKITVSDITKFVAIVSVEKSQELKNAFESYYNETSIVNINIENYFKEKASNYNSSCCMGNTSENKQTPPIQCNESKDVSFSCKDILKKILGNLEDIEVDSHYFNKKNIKFPRSVIDTIGAGFDTKRARCLKNIVDFSYSNSSFYSVQNNITYQLPNELFASQENVDTFTIPLFFITSLQEYLNIALSISIEMDTILGAIITPPFFTFAADASATLKVQNQLEVEGNVLAIAVNSLKILDVKAMPYNTLDNQSNSRFQKDIKQLNLTYSSDYENVICTYGTDGITSGTYGGSIMITFEMDAGFYAENNVEIKAGLEAAVTILNCLLGIKNTIVFGVDLTCNHEFDYWANVNFTISILGGRVPDLLNDFSYNSWVNSVTNYPALLEVGLQPISTFVEDSQKSSLLNEATVNYLQGNFTCDSHKPSVNTIGKVLDSTCYPSTLSINPSASFACSTTNIIECAKDWSNCCSAAIRL